MRCGGRAGHLIHGRDRNRRVWARFHRHDGEVLLDVTQRVYARTNRRDDGHAVHTLVAELLDGVQHVVAIERAKAGHGHRVASIVGCLLDSEQRGSGAVQGSVEAHDAQGLGTAGHQSPGHRVGAIVELPNRREHPFARISSHMGAVVEDPRDGLVRDPGDARDVSHDRGAALLLLER